LKHFSKSAYILEYYNNLVSIKEGSNDLQEDEDEDEEEEVEEPPHPYLPCFYDSDSDDECQHMPNEIIVDNSFKDDEEYGLDMIYDDAPLLMPSDEIASENINDDGVCYLNMEYDNVLNDEPMHEDVLSFYGNLYDKWVENNSNSIIDFSELDPLYDNSLDDDPTCETIVPMSLINEKVFACNDDNHSEVESAIGSTNIL
jgi:hypothetical protein